MNAQEGDFRLENWKYISEQHHYSFLSFKSGNLLSAVKEDVSLLDTIEGIQKLGVDNKGNRYYFMSKALNPSGLIMLDNELGIEIYFDRYQIAIIDKENYSINKLFHKNCGFDVLVFNKCGFFDFRYSIENRELLFKLSRCLLPDKEMKVSLKKSKE
ncbi:MAG: hypothetical protein HND54_09600 [Bacteroidetes bacterium]|nr:hypothetical protein [Bacteroidota bacterium]